MLTENHLYHPNITEIEHETRKTRIYGETETHHRESRRNPRRDKQSLGNATFINMLLFNL